MTFPTIQFKGTNVGLDPMLQTLVEQKFTTLEKYIGDETDVKCEVEFEKETGNHHNTGNIHRVEVNLFFAGKMYRAEASRDSFQTAIDEVQSDLDRELRKANEKQETLLKKGGRKIKEMLRFGKY